MASHTQVNDWSEVNEDFKGEMKRDVNRKIRIFVFPNFNRTNIFKLSR